MKEWRGQRGPKVNEASHVKAAQWAASEDKAGWIESYQDLLYLETLQSIVAALEEEGRPEYDASVWMSPSSPDWFFDHYNRLRPEQMKGMAFLLSTDDGETFPWLGVFENSRVVVLNTALKAGRNPDAGGTVSFKIKVRLLLPIVSDGRRYEACEKCTRPVFAGDVMGQTAPDSCVDDKAPQEKSEGDVPLNPLQMAVARWWVRRSGNGPRFMMLQGPPGTGKTRTAVEILRRSLVVAAKCKRDPSLHKIVCAAPSWTAVYQFAGRFMSECPRDIRVAMTGCSDRTRTAADEPAAVSKISVAAMMADIQRFIRSIDRTRSDLLRLMERIKSQAPKLFKILGRLLTRTMKKDGLTSTANVLQLEFETIKKEAIEEADVVFATLNALGARAVKEALHDSVNTLIIDEAGQASDPDLFIGCALEPRRLLLIGDHKQLPPTVMHPVAKIRGLDCSTLERLFHVTDADADHCRMLQKQYRMPAEVLAWPNRQFYGGKLSTGCTPDAKWDGRRYQFVDVDYGEQEKLGTSYRNTAEAAHVVYTALELKDAEAPLSTILIVTPYGQQRHLLEKYVANYFPGADKPSVSTIDGCQGAERDHVILSLVRTENMSNSFAVEPKHLCVALTRAKQTMTIVGNIDCLAKGGTADIKSLVEDAKRRNVVEKALPQLSFNGEIVGDRFVADDGTVRKVGDIGFHTVDGDKVNLRLTPGGIVTAIDLLSGSPLRDMDIPCCLVNDGNVCFEAPCHDDREAILAAVRQIAADADGEKCNGKEVTVCDRQPVNDNFMTLTMPDPVLAHEFITGKEAVHICVEDSNGKPVMKHVRAVIPQEPRYHKLSPVGFRFTIRVPAAQVVKHGVTHRSIVIVRLAKAGDDNQPRDGVYADIQRCTEDPTTDVLASALRAPGESTLDWWLRSMAGDEDHFEDLRKQLDRAAAAGPVPVTNPRVNGGVIRSGGAVPPPVKVGEVFTISEGVGAAALSTALSCGCGAKGWQVKLYVADPDVSPQQQADRLRPRAADLPVLNGLVRMMPDDVLAASSLAAGTRRQCLVFTAWVTPDGSVVRTQFTTETVAIRANLCAARDADWDALEAPSAAAALEAVVRAMMGKRRFVQEALVDCEKRRVGGPHHAAQYVAALAKRTAAELLGAAYNNRVLFDNLKETGDSTSETALCAERERAMQDPAHLPAERLAARAAAALLRRNALSPVPDAGYHYAAGSSVSFTRPLQRYSDFCNLQILKGCVGGGARAAARGKCSAADLHKRLLVEDNAIRRAGEIDRMVRTPWTNSRAEKVDVIVANDDGDLLYCPVKDSIFPVRSSLGPPGTVLKSLLKLAESHSFLRPEPYHVVPYAKQQKKTAAGDPNEWAVVSPKLRRKPVHKVVDKPRPSIRFAGHSKKELKAVEQNVVFEALYKALAKRNAELASTVFVTADKYQSGEQHRNKYWIVVPKNDTCTFFKKGSCQHQLCTFYHGKVADAKKLFDANTHQLRDTVEVLKKELGCWLKVWKAASPLSPGSSTSTPSQPGSPGPKQPASPGPKQGPTQPRAPASKQPNAPVPKQPKSPASQQPDSWGAEPAASSPASKEPKKYLGWL